MHNAVNIRDLYGVEVSTSQFPLVGYTVFWRLAGIRVSYPDLDQALKATGFDKYLPDPPTPRVALRRALAGWIKAKQQIARSLQRQKDNEEDEGNGGVRRRTLIRVINRAGSEHLVYALVAEDIDFSLLGLSYGTALRILLHKKTGEMTCTTDAEGVIDAQHESRRVTDELAPYWKQYRDLFISRDLSQMMREIVNGMKAVSLRREGGIYIVPASERDSLIRLRQLITDIPKVSNLDPFVCTICGKRRSLSAWSSTNDSSLKPKCIRTCSACSRIRCEPESSDWNEKRSTFLQRRTFRHLHDFPTIYTTLC